MTQMMQMMEREAGEQKAVDTNTQATSHGALINDMMQKSDNSALKASSPELTPLQAKLADLSEHNAAGSDSHGLAAHAVRNVLHSVDIDIPRSDSKDIKDVPKMTQLPEGSKPQPGDLIIVGAQDRVSAHGDSFFMTKDGQAAGDRVKPMPDLIKLHDIHIYRAD